MKWRTIGQVTGGGRNICSRLLCQLIPIDERFFCGYRLTDTNRYQLTNYRLIDCFSYHRFPSIGYPGVVNNTRSDLSNVLAVDKNNRA